MSIELHPIQCHIDPGRHIVTNELFPVVSAMLTARGGGSAVVSGAINNTVLCIVAMISLGLKRLS